MGLIPYENMLREAKADPAQDTFALGVMLGLVCRLSLGSPTCSLMRHETENPSTLDR